MQVLMNDFTVHEFSKYINNHFVIVCSFVRWSGNFLKVCGKY